MYLFIHWCGIHVGEDAYKWLIHIYNAGVDGLIKGKL